MEVVFVAAENGALPGAKVGGVADVVRDLPAALVTAGWSASVLIPSYGTLHRLPGAKKLTDIDISFAGESSIATLWEVPGQLPGTRNLVVDHERFSRDGLGVIYSGDNPDTPFAADASKFAFLCACAAAWIRHLRQPPDVVHLHDWHAAFYAILREFDPACSKLKNIRTVFTIHNLSYQGTRPLAGDASSLEHWYPRLQYDERVVDPTYRNCVNPMASGIRLADKLSTVSSTYADEICLPSDPATAFIGGEGLEVELQQAMASDRLVGILNGIYYDQPNADVSWSQFLNLAKTQVAEWLAEKPQHQSHRLAAKRLAKLGPRPKSVLTSVGRLVTQKATLLEAEASSGEKALAQIAHQIANSGVIVLLGSGEPALEEAVFDIAKGAENILFLNGYSEKLADPLYQLGDLFLMPSSFEPCGISQMLAMRAGQPCVVHGVGGLRDTVQDGVTGFVFNGENLRAQAAAFTTATASAVILQQTNAVKFANICKAAMATRFEWSDAARNTSELLYGVPNAN